MGQEFLEDDERPGRPVEVITEDKVVLVEELVLSDRRLKITAQSGVKCVKCDTVTHRGCLKYLKNVTIIDSDLIVCCEDVPVIPVGCDSDSPFFDAIDHQADDNKKQKDMLIKELYDKIDLLNEKIKFLHEKGDTSAAIKTSTIKTTGSTVTMDSPKNKNKLGNTEQNSNQRCLTTTIQGYFTTTSSSRYTSGTNETQIQRHNQSS
nr:unnamed protein product [Callosobruchus analis]